LAKRAGLSRRGIADLERGARNAPHPATVRRLADALGLAASDRAELLVAARPPTGTAAAVAPIRQAVTPQTDAGRTTTAASAQASLPIPLTSFVGRQRELACARRLLHNTRLLTLTGPGGSGKTRICLRLVAETAAEFPDGVYFVPLAPIRDPGLVLSSIVRHIGLQDSRDRPLIEHLTSFLREHAALLVLDNFEQVLPAATLLAEILTHTKALKLIVTSRACLRISGEQEFPVPPLEVPDAALPRSVSAIANSESVKLFVERASAMLPGFAVDAKNADALAQIVRRLDGLPLAIELAAARVKLLPPEAMLPRLEHSLGVLVTAARDMPERQQTLRSAIAWSYGLLTPAAQRLLATCAVFRGGASLECIESVCGTPVLQALEELVDHNLLRRVDAPAPRFVMLETIREYAAERLADMPQEAAIRESQAAVFLALAEEARRQLTGPGEKEWLERLELEHNNVRAALDWYGRHAPLKALRLAAAMAPFWAARGHFSEGRQRLATLLERVPDKVVTRVRALNGAACLAIDQGDYADGRAKLHESVDLSRALNEPSGEGVALVYLARSKLAAGSSATEATEATPHVEQALGILRGVGDPAAMAFALMYWGLAAYFADQFALACERFALAVEVCRQVGWRSWGARALQLLGCARLDLGDLAAARAAAAEALPTSIDVGDWWIIPIELSCFAGLAAKTGRPRQALRLAGAAVAYSETHDFAVPTAMQRIIERWLAPVRKTLGPAAATVLAEGRHLTLDQAVACALANEPEGAWRASPPQTLTARELEVAKLVARGLTNRDIATQLYLSVRTVDVHVDHILTKLGFNTRTQLAAWAFEANLLPKNT
jgi:non-specific serine/threonine protein kinase